MKQKERMFVEAAYKMPGLFYCVETTVSTARNYSFNTRKQLCQAVGKNCAKKSVRLAKSIGVWIPLLLALSLFASCTKDDALPGDNDESTSALALITLQATDIDVSKAATRAVSTTDYPTANAIGFFVKADATNGYVACDNRKGEYNAARKLWLPTPDSIWLNSHNADIAVYAPYDAAHTTAATLNLTAALRPADGSKDIWCKHITANNTSKNLAVTLEHVYTRLALTVTRDANYKAEAMLSALSLKGDEIYESATYKPFETTPYTYSSTTGLTPTVTEQTLNASTASATYNLLLIPTPLTGDVTLTLTVDGKKMETVIGKTRFAGNKLEAGKQYNVNLTLKPGKLEIASVSLVKWDALPEINGGQAEFDEYILGIRVPEDEINLGGSNCTAEDKKGLSNLVWAKGNLKSTSDGSKNDYVWAGPTEFGYYYTWHSTYTGNTTSNGIDPCTKLSKEYGKGWRTPTRAEMTMLSRCTDAHIVNPNINNGGMWFMNSSTGLFLPRAGNVDHIHGGSGTNPTWGGACMYWTSDAADDRDAYYLSAGEGYANVVARYKTDGFSVRCVRFYKK